MVEADTALPARQCQWRRCNRFARRGQRERERDYAESNNRCRKFHFTNTHTGRRIGNATMPTIAVAATSIGLLTFQRNNTIRLVAAIRAVSQSPIAIFSSNTAAPRIVPIAAAYAPLTKPCTSGLRTMADQDRRNY